MSVNASYFVVRLKQSHVFLVTVATRESEGECVCARVRECVRACALECACVHVCAHVCLHACWCACMPVCVDGGHLYSNICISMQIQRYNSLLNEIRRSLTDLEKGIQGLVVMTLDLEIVFNSLFEGRVPPSWEKVSLNHGCASSPACMRIPATRTLNFSCSKYRVTLLTCSDFCCIFYAIGFLIRVN